MLGDDGLHVVVPHVDGEQPEGADVARVRRHDDAGEVEDVHEPAGQQRAGAAERGQREVADVEAGLTVTWRRALAWFHAEISRMPVAVRSRGRAWRRAGPGRRSAAGTRLERDLPAQQVRRDPAEGDVGVGDGGLVAALGVAHGAGVGAGRLGADLQRALGREPGDRAAAGADGDDVDHRDLGRVVADRALGGERRLAVDDDGDVGRGTAAVAGEDRWKPRVAGDQRGAQGAGGRAGQHRGDRLVHDLVGGEDAAVGLHHVEGDVGG